MIAEVMNGQWDADLGGGVYKQRLHKNMHRAIILAKSGKRWIFEYLFAKNALANINRKQLAGYQTLAKTYAKATEEQIKALVDAKDLVEICHDCKEKETAAG